MIANVEVEAINCQIEKKRTFSSLDGVIIPKRTETPRNLQVTATRTIIDNPGASTVSEFALVRMMTRADIPTNTPKRLVFEYDRDEEQYSIESTDSDRLSRMFQVDPNKAIYTLRKLTELCPMNQRVIAFRLVVNILAAMFFISIAYWWLWLNVLFVFNPLVLLISIFSNIHYLIPGIRLKTQGWIMRRKCKLLESFLQQENKEYYHSKNIEWRIGRFGMWVELTSLLPPQKKSIRTSKEIQLFSD